MLSCDWTTGHSPEKSICALAVPPPKMATKLAAASESPRILCMTCPQTALAFRRARCRYGIHGSCGTRGQQRRRGKSSRALLFSLDCARREPNRSVVCVRRGFRRAPPSRGIPETRRKSVPIGMDPSPSYGLAKQRAKIEGV